MLDFTKLINTSYLLDPRPSYKFSFFWLFITLFLAAIATTAVPAPHSWKPWNATLKTRLNPPLLVFGVVGLLLIFARNQSIAYLGSRMALLLLILASLLWIGYILAAWYRENPTARAEYERRERLVKYLPRPKAQKGR